MHHHPNELLWFAETHARELRVEAERDRLARGARSTPPLRRRLAHTLHTLADRLEAPFVPDLPGRI